MRLSSRPLWTLAQSHGHAAFRLSYRLGLAGRPFAEAVVRAWSSGAYALMRRLNAAHRRRPPRPDCCMRCDMRNKKNRKDS